MLFILFYCLPLFGVAWFAGNSKSNNGVVLKIVLIFFVSIISVFTAPVAVDHDNYVYMYESLKDYSLKDIGFSFIGNSRIQQVEPGYMCLNWIISHLGLTEPFFFLIIALLINTAIVFYVYKHRLPIISLLYLFIGGLLLINEQNLVRQFLAASIFLCALLCLENHEIKHKRIKYISLILFATLFHTSAIILIPFVFFGNDDSEITLRKSCRGDKIAKVVMSGIYIFSLLSIVFPVLAQKMVFLSFFSYYNNYQNTESSVGMSIPIIYFVFYNIIAIISLFYFKYSLRILAVCAIAMAVIYNISFSVPNALRLQAYFSVPTIVYICHCLLSSPQGHKTILGSNVTKLMLWTLGLYIAESALNNFVFHDSILLSETYKLEDFFFNK